ncbi:hypothetical protein ES703_114525 [subsurface metagenome]
MGKNKLAGGQMKPQIKKPIAFSNNLYSFTRKETFNSAHMIMNNRALWFKNGLPTALPGAGTKIAVFTVERFVQRMKSV